MELSDALFERPSNRLSNAPSLVHGDAGVHRISITCGVVVMTSAVSDPVNLLSLTSTRHPLKATRWLVGMDHGVKGSSQLEPLGPTA